MRRVVITGIGVLSAIGKNRFEFEQSLQAGRSGIGKFTNPAFAELRFQNAAEVRGFNAEDHFAPKDADMLDRFAVPASIGLGTSPHDLFEEYGRVFGNDISQLFPVIDTEIGKLGTMTCHDGCTPEVSRALGYNGCEVICHPVALQEIEGVSEPWDFWKFSRRTRAHDNMCYLLGSNWGTVDYAYYPRSFCPGHSFVIDYTGMILRQAEYPSEQVISATIDIESLREHRSRCNHNCWVDVRTEGFRQILRKTDLSAESLSVRQTSAQSRGQDGPRQRRVSRSLRARALHASGRTVRQRHAEAA